jgi:Bifunctional DNA primase/polymerase, N-terminal
MSALEQALAIAERYPVFPCKVDKAPATPHGFKDASKDPATIRALWRSCAGPLVGVPTGQVSGIDALDIDPRHGGDSWLRDADESLPTTRRNHTRSGGTHIFFRHAAGVKNTASKIAPGVDTRGQGGYVIWWSAAGCAIEHPEQLADWPRGLLRILCPPKSERRPVAVPANRAEANTRASLMIERAFDRVRSARPGERHYQLRAAAATLGGLVQYLNQSRSEIEETLVSLIMQTGAEDAVGAAKTARWALEKGCSSPLLARR